MIDWPLGLSELEWRLQLHFLHIRFLIYEINSIRECFRHILTDNYVMYYYELPDTSKALHLPSGANILSRWNCNED
jgi:hypothetical protein